MLVVDILGKRGLVIFKESAPRPILSSSCDVRPYVYILSPLHAIFLKVCHWPSDSFALRSHDQKYILQSVHALKYH